MRQDANHIQRACAAHDPDKRSVFGRDHVQNQRQSSGKQFKLTASRPAPRHLRDPRTRNRRRMLHRVIPSPSPGSCSCLRPRRAGRGLPSAPCCPPETSMATVSLRCVPIKPTRRTRVSHREFPLRNTIARIQTGVARISAVYGTSMPGVMSARYPGTHSSLLHATRMSRRILIHRKAQSRNAPFIRATVPAHGTELSTAWSMANAG